MIMPLDYFVNHKSEIWFVRAVYSEKCNEILLPKDSMVGRGAKLLTLG